MNAIKVKDLVRTFTIPKKREKMNLLEKFKQMVWPEKKTFTALKGVSFKVKKGEIFGYLGPNGAGKSTTIKILTGILTPDSGSVDCLGFTPWKERLKYTKRIGVMFGQKSLLWWDIPVRESFLLYKDIYEISDDSFKEKVEYYSRILNIGHLMNIPVRKLSMGERMKCELASSLLHDPEIVFMDEPTIGLDAVSRENMIKFIKQVNEEFDTTIFLTTHYMRDVEELCKRIIVLDKGKKVYEGGLEKFKNKFVQQKVLEFEVNKFRKKREFNKIIKEYKTLECAGKYYKLGVPAEEKAHNILANIMETAQISDATITQPDLEKIIGTMYKQIPKE